MDKDYLSLSISFSPPPSPSDSWLPVLPIPDPCIHHSYFFKSTCTLTFMLSGPYNSPSLSSQIQLGKFSAQSIGKYFKLHPLLLNSFSDFFPPTHKKIHPKIRCRVLDFSSIGFFLEKLWGKSVWLFLKAYHGKS